MAEPSNHQRSPAPLTVLLKLAADGDDAAHDQLMKVVYGELHQMAEAAIAREARGHSLQATVLINDAYLKLFGKAKVDWDNRRHFFGAAARAMQQMLINEARRRKVVRRRLGTRLALSGIDVARDSVEVDTASFVQAMRRLDKARPRAAEIASLRFVSGKSVQETAEMMGVSPRTVELDTTFARAFLQREMAAS